MEQDMQEEKIKDAVVTEVEEAKEEAKTEEVEKNTVVDLKKRKKREYYAELVLFLALGVLIGIAMKTEAIKKITVGFDDYKMKIEHQDYNINQFQKDLAKANAEQQSQQQEEGAAQGQPQAGGSDSNQGNVSQQGESPAPTEGK